MTPFKGILVDIDAGANAQPALERAAQLARISGAELRIVDAGSLAAAARHELRAELDDSLMRRRRHQLARIGYGVRDVAVEVEMLAGPPAEALTRDVLRFGHDLVVRSHARDLVASSTAPDADVDVQLLRHCPCPVWAVGPGVGAANPRIVALVDGSADDPVKQQLTSKVAELSLHLKNILDGSLLLLQTWRPFSERRVHDLSTTEDFSVYLESSRRHAKHDLARLADSFGDRLAGVQFELRRGEIEDVIPEFAVAEGVDLVVMGTMGWAGLAHRLIGNTAERVLRRLPCSLLAIKPDGFVSSVRVE
jgi:universal stress protein E